MARSGFPSMTALLGLLAVAGYQNRDKISEMLNNRGAGGGMGGGMGGMGGASGGGLGGLLGGLGGQGGAGGGLGGLLAGLGGGAAGGGLGGLLGGGLNELDGHMRQNGRGEVMDSWVGTGPNHSMEPHDLEAALGPDVLQDLEEHTGLSRSEILSRLSRELPHAVDQYTPDGRIPDRNMF
ncbi:YidB family protein [Rubellimicrobium arenae]|uniref:YidB family protein n=1 Tax=Rubellimicrobium arenae TaxID=2817372 RepID=UPI001B31819B|nr:YidB family protein [Rubellimicrobium arenae]